MAHRRNQGAEIRHPERGALRFGRAAGRGSRPNRRVRSEHDLQIRPLLRRRHDQMAQTGQIHQVEDLHVPLQQGGCRCRDQGADRRRRSALFIGRRLQIPVLRQPGQPESQRRIRQSEPGSPRLDVFRHAGNRRSDECDQRPAPSHLFLSQQGRFVRGYCIHA